jgi:membrane-associated phospholipid phosphatase
MALTIIEESLPTAWSTNKSIIYAIISLLMGLIIFAFSYIGMSQQSGIGALNQTVLSWMIDHRQSQITDVMKIMTAVASPLILTVFVCIFVAIWAFFNREIWRPLLLIIATGIAGASSWILKILTSNERPPEISMIKPLETDFSFPSGHTIGMVVFLLVISYLICSRRPSGWRIFSWTIITTIGVGIIAVSRLYLGYHWLTDVIASLGLGLIILALAIFIDRLVVNRFEG